MVEKKKNPNGSKTADRANAWRPVDALTAPEWHRQPLEGDAAWSAFSAWLELDDANRTIDTVRRMRGVARTTISNLSSHWRWNDRLRARQNADAAVVDAERQDELRAMVRRHASQAKAQLEGLQRVADEIGKRVSAGKFSFKGVTDAELLRLLQLGAAPTSSLVHVERVARGLPATAIGTLGDDETRKSLGSGSYLDLARAANEGRTAAHDEQREIVFNDNDDGDDYAAHMNDGVAAPVDDTAEPTTTEGKA